ncbi:MAG TPA: DNA repair protein RadC [Candidatus Limisoma intestinavium]|uniref:DNA repair protein RadC n=1 Tax=Candidatus Limisoma intestinavium TaxID=2840856 RepID=A0A9D1IL40_9BACT|nr:DNA repair protein RadC [Candidatus Limisoma intestinavium]
MTTDANYNRRIADLTKEDRPREKALAKGLDALTTTELIAILLGSGTQGESVVDLAQRLLKESDNKLSELSKRSVRNLVKSFKGIGEAKAITLLSAIELGKRYAQENIEETPTLNTPDKVFATMRYHFADLQHEEFWAIYLNNAKRMISKIRISQGGVSATIIDPKIILRYAIENLATAIILVHNHPSGNLMPSREDDNQTERIAKAAKLFDIQLVDHLIVAAGNFYSYANEGRL